MEKNSLLMMQNYEGMWNNYLKNGGSTAIDSLNNDHFLNYNEEDENLLSPDYDRPLSRTSAYGDDYDFTSSDDNTYDMSESDNISPTICFINEFSDSTQNLYISETLLKFLQEINDYLIDKNILLEVNKFVFCLNKIYQ